MARRPYITPSDIPTARLSRCLSFPDSLEWEALVNGFLAMGTRIENWQQLPGGIDPEEAVAACVEFLNDFFEAGECGIMRPVGEVSTWMTDTAPDGWLICDGQSVSRTTYADLFALWGEGFGAGDGTTTFNLPDFRFRSPIGTGSNFDETVSIGVGGQYGTETATLGEEELPAHNHAITDPGHNHGITDPGHTHPPLSPSTTFLGNKPSGTNTAPASTFLGTSATTGSATTGITVNDDTTGISISNTGDGLPFSIVHPVLGVNFIVFTGVV